MFINSGRRGILGGLGPILLAVLAIVVLAIVASQAFFSRASAAPQFRSASAGEKAVALGVALAEAARTLPEGGTTTVGEITTSRKWPSNITKVSYVASDRQSAASLTGWEPTNPENVAVVVVRMTGFFRVEIPAPRGVTPYVTGHQMTIVADSTTGQMLDFDLEPTDSTVALPAEQALLPTS